MVTKRVSCRNLYIQGGCTIHPVYMPLHLEYYNKNVASTILFKRLINSFALEENSEYSLFTSKYMYRNPRPKTLRFPRKIILEISEILKQNTSIIYYQRSNF